MAPRIATRWAISHAQSEQRMMGLFSRSHCNVGRPGRIGYLFRDVLLDQIPVCPEDHFLDVEFALMARVVNAHAQFAFVKAEIDYVG